MKELTIKKLKGLNLEDIKIMTLSELRDVLEMKRDEFIDELNLSIKQYKLRQSLKLNDLKNQNVLDEIKSLFTKTSENVVSKEEFDKLKTLFKEQFDKQQRELEETKEELERVHDKLLRFIPTIKNNQKDIKGIRKELKDRAMDIIDIENTLKKGTQGETRNNPPAPDYTDIYKDDNCDNAPFRVPSSPDEQW